MAQRRQRPLLSWRKASRRSRATSGRPARATPSAVETTPSMPFGAAVGVGGAAGPPNHSRSRTGIDDAHSWAPSGMRSATILATPGSDELRRVGKDVGDRALRRCRGRRPAASQPSEPGRARRRSRASRPPTPAQRQRPVVGVDHARAADLHAVRRRRRSMAPAPSRPAGGRCARRRRACGRRRTPRWRRSASKVVTAPARCAAARLRVGEHRPAGRLRQRRARRAVTPPRPPARISPSPIEAQAASSARQSTDARHRAAGRPLGAVAAPGAPRSGSRNGRLRCTGPGRRGRDVRRTPANAIGAPRRRRGPQIGNGERTRPYRRVWSMVWGAPRRGAPAGGRQ